MLGVVTLDQHTGFWQRKGRKMGPGRQDWGLVIDGVMPPSSRRWREKQKAVQKRPPDRCSERRGTHMELDTSPRHAGICPLLWSYLPLPLILDPGTT